MEKQDFNVVEKDSSNVKKPIKKFAQSFKSVVPTYQLDEKTHKLVETGFRDIQKEIDSYADCALNKMLDKFLNVEDKISEQFNVVDTDEVVETANNFDLADLGEALEVAEIYREKYGLPLSSTPHEIFAYIKQKEKDVNSKIENLKLKNEKGEIYNNA